MGESKLIALIKTKEQKHDNHMERFQFDYLSLRDFERANEKWAKVAKYFKSAEFLTKHRVDGVLMRANY